MVDFIQEVSKRYGSGFSRIFKADFFLIYQQLETEKKAIVNLMFSNHLN